MSLSNFIEQNYLPSNTNKNIFFQNKPRSMALFIYLEIIVIEFLAKVIIFLYMRFI